MDDFPLLFGQPEIAQHLEQSQSRIQTRDQGQHGTPRCAPPFRPRARSCAASSAQAISGSTVRSTPSRPNAKQVPARRSSPSRESANSAVVGPNRNRGDMARVSARCDRDVLEEKTNDHGGKESKIRNGTAKFSSSCRFWSTSCPVQIRLEQKITEATKKECQA